MNISLRLQNSGSLPVLIQGETSVGKTSLITYLADRVGQVCYRINNHEHTDQQTYMGTYTVASATAQAKPGQSQSELVNPPPLVFQEGPLVQAMRAGCWIILDELNLAPTEILEALNRVNIMYCWVIIDLVSYGFRISLPDLIGFSRPIETGREN